MNKIKIGHIASAYLPRLGGIPCYIRDLCMNLDMYHHSIFVRDLYRCKGGFEIKRDTPGRHDYGYAECYKFHQPLPELFDDNFRSDTICKDQLEAINNSDIDVLLVHGLLLDFEYAINRIDKPIILVNHFYNSIKPITLSKTKACVVFKQSKVATGIDCHIKPFVDYDVFKDYEEGHQSICYIGRIAPEKQLEQLVGLLGGYHLTVIGEADHDEYLHSLQQSIDRHQARVTIMSPMFDSRLAREICKSRYFVIPSKKESYCISLLQGLSCNRICLSVNTDGLEWCDGWVKNIDHLNHINEIKVSNTRDWVITNYNKDDLRKRWSTCIERVLNG